MQNRVLVWALFWLCVQVGAGTPPTTLEFFSLGERRGEVAPCGCPRVQLGGLNRLSAFTEGRPAQGPRFLLDTGNSFFGLPLLPESRLVEGKGRAELIADAYRVLGVQVLSPGPRDFAAGASELARLTAKAGLKTVSANLHASGKSPVFATETVLEKAGVRLGVTGAVAETDSVPGYSTEAPVPSLEKAHTRLKQQKVDFTVALLSDRSLEEKVSAIGFDLLLFPPEQVEGKTVAWERWNLADKARKEKKEEELTPDWEKPSAFSAAYDRYLASVREAALDKSSARTIRTPGMYVAQAGTCRQCHQKQYDFWENTKHASAYLVLFAKNQHLNPECISCHSLGFYDPKGFKDITAPIRLHGQSERKKGEIPFVENFMTEIFAADPGKGPLDSRTDPARYAVLKKRYHEKIHAWQKEGKIDSLHMGVQCEHCHGIRDGHPGPGFKKVGKVKAASCTECHTPPHDESFNFAKRVKLIACPRNR